MCSYLLQVAGLDAASVTGEQLPAKYKSLVATSVGVSFRDVATVVENDLKSPGEGEVRGTLGERLVAYRDCLFTMAVDAHDCLAGAGAREDCCRWH